MAERLLKTFVCLAGIFLLVTLGMLALQARNTLRQADALMSDATTRLDDTSRNANAILIQAGLAADQARLVSIEQRRQLSAISKRALVLLDHADNLLVTATGTVDKLGVDTDASLKEIPQVMRDLDASIKTFNETAADPNIKKTLANVASTTQHTSETMAHVEKAADGVQKRVDQMLKPVSLLRRTGEAALKYFLWWLK
jgi:hypothetical protein